MSPGTTGLYRKCAIVCLLQRYFEAAFSIGKKGDQVASVAKNKLAVLDELMLAVKFCESTFMGFPVFVIWMGTDGEDVLNDLGG